MKVTVYCINKGTSSQCYGLMVVDGDDRHDWFVMPYAPNNWKTKRGAINWAKREGLEVIE